MTMKYISLKSVVEAYSANRYHTKNKFWGLLSILSNLDSIVQPGVSYDFLTSRVATFLESLFCIDDTKREYQNGATWNIMLSNQWTVKVSEQMLNGTPNIYDVATWYFRDAEFKDDIKSTDLISLFLSHSNISIEDAKDLFDFREKEVEFVSAQYDEFELQKALKLGGTNITAEGATIVAHPGELSRAPFIQTLYAGQSTLECLIITPFRFGDLYYGKRQQGRLLSSLTPSQTIYYGSPGTGKSHTVEKFIKEVKEKNPSITDYRTTFHPDYDYASFVGSYKPVVKQDSLHKGKKYTEDELAAIYVKNVVPAENISIGFVEQRIKFGVDFCEYFNGDIAEYDINHILELAGKEAEAGSKNRVGFTYVQYGVKIGPDTRRLVNESTITYEFVPQVFTMAYVDAWNKLEEGTPVYLVIEEINRGNCAQIFGDIFQLLDRKDDGYSKYPVVPDTDLKDYLTGLENWGKTHLGIADGLCLPPNLNIIATMNTSDQSLFPMDSAFKRRWDWKFIPIDPDCPDSQFKITIGEKHFSWASFITKVNQRILNLTESEDKQIGNFFIKKDIDADEFKSKVMFYLWNDVCKEHYNAGSFFKYTSGEDVENEFTFNQLFASDATCILQGFMEYLEVEEK